MLAPISAFALPENGVVTAGTGTISTPMATTMRIDQATDQMAVDWTRFNIANNEAVHFQQPSAASVALNRVLANEASGIFGTLTATGQVIISNTSGILFGPNSRVDVGALTATTLNITNEDFLNGASRFVQQSGSSNAAVINQGFITVAQGGYVALLGAAVRNEGIIQANLGTVALGAGSAVTLDMRGDDLIGFVVSDAVSGSVTGPNGQSLASYVSNTGTLQADGGLVALQANTLADIVTTAINLEGVLRANTLEQHNGRIILAGGPAGLVTVSGTVGASGHHVPSLLEGEGQGEGGLQGGNITITGQYVDLFGAALNASGDAGGGTVLVGGDFQEENASVQNASRTYVSADSTITADAVTSGNGGKVIVWADEWTKFSGSITARGGAQNGDGGFVEVSGKENLAFTGTVNVGAPNGVAGTILLDSDNITIVDAGGADDGEVTPGVDEEILFDDGGAVDFTINDEALEALTGNVTLQANQDITVDFGLSGGLNFVHVGAGESVTFEAGGNITVGSALSTNGGAITLSSTGSIAVEDDIDSSTNGATTTLAAGEEISQSGGTIFAGDLILEAVNGIGARGEFLRTSVTNLQATNTNNGVEIANTGDVTLTNLGAGYAIQNTNGAVLVNSTGSITVDSTVTAGKRFSLRADTDVFINADLSGTGLGGNRTSELVADAQGNGAGEVVQNATSQIAVTDGGDLDIGIVCAPGGGCGSGGGGDTQNIVLGTVDAGTGTVKIRTEDGGVQDANGAGTLNVTAAELVIRSEQGVDLDTQVDRIDAFNGRYSGAGDIAIRNTGDLTVACISMCRGALNEGGAITLSSTGSIAAEDIGSRNNGATTMLTAGDEIVQSGGTIFAAGDLILNAGAVGSGTVSGEDVVPLELGRIGGELSGDAGGLFNVRSTGALTIGFIDAGGEVVIASTGGAINAGVPTGPDDTNIVAPRITFFANQIAAAGQELVINVGSRNINLVQAGTAAETLSVSETCAPGGTPACFITLFAPSSAPLSAELLEDIGAITSGNVPGGELLPTQTGPSVEILSSGTLPPDIFQDTTGSDTFIIGGPSGGGGFWGPRTDPNSIRFGK